MNQSERDQQMLDKALKAAHRQSESSTAPVNQTPEEDGEPSREELQETKQELQVVANELEDKKYHESYPQVLVLPRLFTKSAWKLLIVTTIIVNLFIWLYIGSVWSPNTRIHNIEITIYNNDAGFDYSQTDPTIAQDINSLLNNTSLGTFVQNSIMNSSQVIFHAFYWKVHQPVPGWTREDVVDLVEKGHTWGVIYIPSNFSNNLLTFAPSLTGPATIDSLKPSSMEYIYDQGRSYATQSLADRYMIRVLQAFFLGIEKYALNSPYNQTLLQSMNPNLWVEPVGYTETVLHPVHMYGQNLSSYLIFIALFVGSTLTVYTTCKFLPDTVESVGVLDFVSAKYPALQIVFARYMIGVIFSLVHATFVWLVPTVLNGYQLDYHYNNGKAWVFIWMVCLAFVSILYLMARLLTVDGFQAPATIFMILMFTASGGILDLIVQPGFYRIGQAFPFFYAVRGMRTIWFGSLRNKMWINWMAISLYILIPSVITIIIARNDLRLRREIMRRKAQGKPLPEKKHLFGRLKK
ncbi:hypothetical protein BGZ46_003992 [Entomortierella lignicola]|nr:hypothetical protein BGZ46_003992 [Entomortierella lignicola]